MKPREDFPKIYMYRRIVQAKLYIDRYYYQSINLDNIADEAFFSKFHFIRLFKSIYQTTPHQYLTAVRIKHAQLLLQDAKPVADVCYTVGFDSITSFSALFKKLIGQSPSVYQEQQLKRKQEIEQLPLKYIPNCFAESNGWT